MTANYSSAKTLRVHLREDVDTVYLRRATNVEAGACKCMKNLSNSPVGDYRLLSRRRALEFVALLVLLAAFCAHPMAQSYPTKPVRIVVPYVAGGATDLYARVVGKGMSEELGQQFIVENRPGAATIIGAQVVAQAPKDGYTLLFTVSATLSANPHLYKQLPYRAEDFAPISLMGSSHGWTISIHPSIPAKTVRELVAFAKGHPAKIVMGSLGPGSGPFLVGKTFERLAGLSLTEVSYKGSAEAMRDLLAGHIAMYCEGIAGALPQHKAGKLRILAITGGKRSPELPDVPTFLELGFADLVVTNLWGLFAPAGTPNDIVTRLNAAMVHTVERESFRSRLAADGVNAESSTPAALGELIRRDSEIWQRIIAPLRILLG